MFTLFLNHFTCPQFPTFVTLLGVNGPHYSLWWWTVHLTLISRALHFKIQLFSKHFKSWCIKLNIFLLSKIKDYMTFLFEFNKNFKNFVFTAKIVKNQEKKTGRCWRFKNPIRRAWYCYFFVIKHYQTQGGTQLFFQIQPLAGAGWWQRGCGGPLASGKLGGELGETAFARPWGVGGPAHSLGVGF